MLTEEYTTSISLEGAGCASPAFFAPDLERRRWTQGMFDAIDGGYERAEGLAWIDVYRPRA